MKITYMIGHRAQNVIGEWVFAVSDLQEILAGPIYT